MRRYSLILRVSRFARPTQCFSTQSVGLSDPGAVVTPTPIKKTKKHGVASRIKGYFRYRKAQVIEAREAFDLSILDKVLIISKSLDKQTLITPLETQTVNHINEGTLTTADSTILIKQESTDFSLHAIYHPLWETSIEIKSVAKRSDPKNVLSNIETLLSHTIKKASNTLPNQLLTDSLFATGFTDLLQPSPSSPATTTSDSLASINSNHAQKICQQFLRVTLLREYLKRLKKVIDSGDMPLTLNPSSICKSSDSNSNINSSKADSSTYVNQTVNDLLNKKDKMVLSPDRVVQLCYSFLLGTSSERMTEHLHLYGHELSQYQLQESFYMLFEPEVHSISNLVELLSSSHQQLFKTQRPVEAIIAKYDIRPSVNGWKRIQKRFMKYASGYGYLLDVLEVNSKARCVFAWTDPNHSGFKALPDDHIFPVHEVLASRQLYFKEAETVGASLVNSFTSSTRLVYEEEKENRSNFRYGVVFVILTIALDWIVCVI